MFDRIFELNDNRIIVAIYCNILNQEMNKIYILFSFILEEKKRKHRNERQ